MPTLNVRSGGGSPEYTLTDEDFSNLSKAIGKKIDAQSRARLQEIVDKALYWGSLEFDVDAKPIFDFYRRMERGFAALANEARQGPKSDRKDAHLAAEYAFKPIELNGYRLDLPHLPIVLEGLSRQFGHARENLETKHTSPGKPGPKSGGLVNLFVNLADFAESVGATPSAAYDAYKDKNNRETPFVRFCDELRRILADYFPETKAKTVSIVRNALAKRAEFHRRRAAEIEKSEGKSIRGLVHKSKKAAKRRQSAKRPK